MRPCVVVQASCHRPELYFQETSRRNTSTTRYSFMQVPVLSPARCVVLVANAIQELVKKHHSMPVHARTRRSFRRRPPSSSSPSFKGSKTCTDKSDQQWLQSLRLRDPSSSSSNEREDDTTKSEQSQQHSAIASAVIRFIPVSSPSRFTYTHAQSINLAKPAVEYSPCVCVRHRHRRPHEPTFAAKHRGRALQYGNTQEETGKAILLGT